MWKSRFTPAQVQSFNPSQPSASTTSNPTDSTADSISRRRSLVSSVSAFANLTRPKTKQKTSLRTTFTSQDSIRESDPDSQTLSGGDAASMRSKSAVNLAASSSNTAGAGSSSTEPLLTLLLSSTSFLDTTIMDGAKKLYVIDTRASRTSICRDEPGKGIVHCGAIHWVQDNAVDRTLGIIAETTVHMAGSRKVIQREFLKTPPFSTTKQFSIPNFPYTLKWKKTSGLLTLSVTKGKEKTTVATLEPAILEAPPRIRVYDPLYEPDPTRPLKEHRGIPVLLLDYLITTALLVCSDKHEWLAASSQAIVSPKAEKETSNLIQQWRHHVESVAEEENIKVPSRVGRAESSSAGSSSSIVDVSLESVYAHQTTNNLDTPKIHDRRSLEISSPSTNSNPSTIFTSFSNTPHPYALPYGLEDGSSPASDFAQSIYSEFPPNEHVSRSSSNGAEVERGGSGHGRMASRDARSEPDRPRYAASIMSRETTMSAPQRAEVLASPASASTTNSSRRRPLPTIPTGGPPVPPVPNIPPELLARLNLGQRTATGAGAGSGGLGVGVGEFGEQAQMPILETNALGIGMHPHPHPSSPSTATGPSFSFNERQTQPSSPETYLPYLNPISGQASVSVSGDNIDPRRRTNSESTTTMLSPADGPRSLTDGLGNLSISPAQMGGAGARDANLGAGVGESSALANTNASANTNTGTGARLQHRMSLYKGPRPGDEPTEREPMPPMPMPSYPVHSNAIDAGALPNHAHSQVHPLRIREAATNARPWTSGSVSVASSSTSTIALSPRQFTRAVGGTPIATLGEELDIDVEHGEIADGEFAPPSYDSIDFSRPAVKPHEQPLREVR